MTAVRSKDLDAERWDLFSVDALEILAHAVSNSSCFNISPKHMIGESISELGKFHAGFENSEDGVVKLRKAWAYLAIASQKLGMSEKEFYKWSQGIEGTGFHNLPYYALKGIAAASQEGAIKYGNYNWLFGFPISGTTNHTMHHLVAWCNDIGDEDHLGHANWGFMTSIHFLLKRPELCEPHLGPDYTITDSVRKYLDEHANRKQFGKEDLLVTN